MEIKVRMNPKFYAPYIPMIITRFNRRIETPLAQFKLGQWVRIPLEKNKVGQIYRYVVDSSPWRPYKVKLINGQFYNYPSSMLVEVTIEEAFMLRLRHA